MNHRMTISIGLVCLVICSNASGADKVQDAYLQFKVQSYVDSIKSDSFIDDIGRKLANIRFAKEHPEEWLLRVEALEPAKLAITTAPGYVADKDDSQFHITIVCPNSGADDSKTMPFGRVYSSTEGTVVLIHSPGVDNFSALLIVKHNVTRVSDGFRGQLEFRRTLTFHKQVDRDNDSRWDRETCWQLQSEETIFEVDAEDFLKSRRK